MVCDQWPLLFSQGMHPSTEHVNAHQQRKHLLGGHVQLKPQHAAAVAGAGAVDATAVVAEQLTLPRPKAAVDPHGLAMAGQAQPHPDDVATDGSVGAEPGRAGNSSSSVEQQQGSAVQENAHKVDVDIRGTDMGGAGMGGADTSASRAEFTVTTDAAAAAGATDATTAASATDAADEATTAAGATDAAVTTDATTAAGTTQSIKTPKKAIEPTATLPFARHRRRKRPRPATDPGYGDGYGTGNYFDYATDTVRCNTIVLFYCLSVFGNLVLTICCGQSIVGNPLLAIHSWQSSVVVDNPFVDNLLLTIHCGAIPYSPIQY